MSDKSPPVSSTPQTATQGTQGEAAARAPRPTAPSRMEPLATLPVFFKLQGRRVVIAGATDAALWKAELLIAAGAQVSLFAHQVPQAFRDLAVSAAPGTLTLTDRQWQHADLAGAALAIGAMTDDMEAAAFAAAARGAGAAVNIIDRPQHCDFQFGSIVNRSPLVVAISTDGAAPVFGQAIRSRIEAMLPLGFKRWAEAAKAWRREGARLGADMAARRRFWERFADRAMRDPNHAPAAADLEALIGDGGGAAAPRELKGFVSLVGAGPGDAELMTLKAVRALRAADVVLYDDLVTASVLDFARREARRMLVGKTGYGPACKQTEINALMVTLAKEGNRVVRLKSGDPMIFGRGGEEMADLTAAGIAFEVIPGISAAQAAAARLPVSLTHRDHAKRVQFVTGHSRQGRLPDTLDWAALADDGATTVVYMAQRTLPELRERLLAAGIAPGTPAFALISVSREGDERIVPSTVRFLVEDLAAAAASGPCLVMYGEALRPALERWQAATETSAALAGGRAASLPAK